MSFLQDMIFKGVTLFLSQTIYIWSSKYGLCCSDLYVQHNSSPGSTGQWGSASGTAIVATSQAYAHWHTKRKPQLDAIIFHLRTPQKQNFIHLMPLPFTKLAHKHYSSPETTYVVDWAWQNTYLLTSSRSLKHAIINKSQSEIAQYKKLGQIPKEKNEYF